MSISKNRGTVHVPWLSMIAALCAGLWWMQSSPAANGGDEGSLGASQPVSAGVFSAGTPGSLRPRIHPAVIAGRLNLSLGDGSRYVDLGAPLSAEEAARLVDYRPAPGPLEGPELGLLDRTVTPADAYVDLGRAKEPFAPRTQPAVSPSSTVIPASMSAEIEAR